MNNIHDPAAKVKNPHPQWMKSIKVFEKPSLKKAAIQILNTLIPLVLVWALAAYSVLAQWSYFITAAILIPGAFLLVRTFIFFHDCTHGSFFKSSKLNAFWGTIFGILTFTPYDDWRQSHGIHHNTHGDLDRRGVGDVWTLTLEEYRQSSWGMRLWYRVYRHPVALFLLIPPILFFILQRIPRRKISGRERASVWITNAGLALVCAVIGLTLGWQVVLLVHLPMFYISSVMGVWLFYVQHQFDPGYWERNSHWNPVTASIEGSSHYKLPKVLQWLTGNIGLHHIHHARPRIPNYNLQSCYDATVELQLKDPLRFWTSFKSMNMHIWDEASRRLLSFSQAKKVLASQ